MTQYKIAIAVALSSVYLGYVILLIFRSSTVGWFLAVSYLVVGVFSVYPSVKKKLAMIKAVSYDDENLYVEEGDYEIQIPFYQVKDVEIVSLDGLYKFHLYHHDQFGKEVICKPSMWYPLNFKSVDKELNRVRALVRKAHREYKGEAVQGNALSSFN